MQQSGYKVVKVLNNNVVFAENETRQEVVLVGKGLGFGKKPGDQVTEQQIEKEYRLSDANASDRYRQLLTQTDESIVGVCEEIIQYAANKLGEPLHPHIRIALTDHISFAIERTRSGQAIVNTILAETRSLYPEEYEIAEHALQMIHEQIGVPLPKGEAGFIAMHLHSARTNSSVGKVLRSVELVAELVQLIEQRLGRALDESSLDYARLVTHLRFTIERIETGQFNENGLVPLLKRDFPTCYSIAEQVANKIEQALGLHVPESEIGYMAIHLTRLQTKMA